MLEELFARTDVLLGRYAAGEKGASITGDDILAFVGAGLLLDSMLGDAGRGDERAEVQRALTSTVEGLYGPADAAAGASYAHQLMQRIEKAGRTRLADALGARALEIFPHGAHVYLEIQSLRASMAQAEGRWEDSQELLTAAAEVMAAGSLARDELDRARASLSLESAWGRHHFGLGVFDLADQHLSDALENSEKVGALDLSLLNVYSDFLLESQAHDRLLALQQSWRASAPALFRVEEASPNERKGLLLLELQRGIALSERAREAGASPSDALDVLEALIDESSGFAGVLDPSIRIKIELLLTDIALRFDDFSRARERLAVAEGLIARHGVGSNRALRSVYVVYSARIALANEAEDSELRAHYDRLVVEANRQFDSWRAFRRPKGGVGFLQLAARRQVLSALIELTLRLESEAPLERALDWVLLAQSLGTLAADLGILGPPSLSEIREEYLEPGHAVLVFLPGKLEQSSHCFAFDREELHHVSLPSRDVILAAMRDVELELVGASGLVLDELERGLAIATLKRGGRTLGDLLLPPESKVRELVLASKTLTVVGADLFGRAPIEAVLLEGEGVLGTTHAVQSLSSLPVGLELVRRSPLRHARRFALFSNLNVGSAASERFGVQSAELEEQDLAPLLDPFRNSSGPEAGPRTGAAAGAEDSTVWHLAGPDVRRDVLAARVEDIASTATVLILAHGVFLEGLERGAALLLNGGSEESPAQVLTCDEIEDSLRFSGVVLLASCGSGLGPARLGDDTLPNLGGALLAAGARGVVLSRAALELNATLDLFARASHGLAAGASVAEALRRARFERAEEGDDLVQFLDARVRAYGATHLRDAD